MNCTQCMQAKGTRFTKSCMNMPIRPAAAPSCDFFPLFISVVKADSFLSVVGSPEFDSTIPKQVPPFSQLSYQLLWETAQNNCFDENTMIKHDIYLDFACPWCYVGFLRFHSVLFLYSRDVKALETYRKEVHVHNHTVWVPSAHNP